MNNNNVNSTNYDAADHIIMPPQANSIHVSVIQDTVSHMNALNEFEDKMIKKHLIPDANQAL
jgi:hypothetical protein